ncbi:MAG: hypothetical protein JXX28_11760 [Deltaproteobacteria bacterium]|nr:hypothetical protein [Deltaproteobacteria bacterium]
MQIQHPEIPRGSAPPPQDRFHGYLHDSLARQSSQARPHTWRRHRSRLHRRPVDDLAPAPVVIQEALAWLSQEARGEAIEKGGLLSPGGMGLESLERHALEDWLRAHPETFHQGHRLLMSLDHRQRQEWVETLVERRAPRGEDRFLLRRGLTGEEQIFARVSTRYHVRDAPWVLSRLNLGRLAPARAAFAYNGETTAWRLDLIEHDTARKFGRVMVLRGNDRGDGGLHLDAAAVRFLCTNLALLEVDRATAQRWHLSHIEPEAALDKLIESASQLGEVPLGPFVARWERLAEQRVADRLGEEDIERVLLALAGWIRETLHLRSAFRSDEILAAYLRRGFEREPGDRLDALLNAVTATHHDPHLSQERAARLEQAVAPLMQALDSGDAFLEPWLSAEA